MRGDSYHLSCLQLPPNFASALLDHREVIGFMQTDQGVFNAAQRTYWCLLNLTRAHTRHENLLLFYDRSLNLHAMVILGELEHFSN